MTEGEHKGCAAIVVRLDAAERLTDARFTAIEKLSDQRFSSQERAVGAALEAAKIANDKAEKAMEKRLEGLNEFREVLTTQQSTLLHRTEYQQGIDGIKEKIAAIENVQSAGAGRGSGTTAAWQWVVAAIGLVFAAVGIALTAAAMLGRAHQ